jgi:signal transduction histidine kinase
VIVDRILERLGRVDARLVDWAVAVAFTAIALAGLLTTPVGDGGRIADPLSAVLAVAMNLPLAIRRRHPSLVLSVIGCSTVLYYLTGPYTGFGLGVLFALYSLAAHGSPGDASRGLVCTMLGVGISFLGILLNVPTMRLLVWLSELLTTWLTFGVAWLLGDLVRARTAALAELRVRAAELEAEREENERLAVQAERARIARELHDAVAHNVSVMVVQAGAARRTLETGAGQTAVAGEALAAIETTGRATLADMRRMVGALRPAEGETYEPAPSLAGLGALIDRIRGAGIAVELVVEGDRRDLPQGLDLSAYRVVQEALTNTLRHARAASARVLLRYTPDALEVEVVDDGCGAAAAMLEAPHHGYGLVGMRERVAMLGGEVTAAPRVGGGFEVRARLPLQGRALPLQGPALPLEGPA